MRKIILLGIFVSIFLSLFFGRVTEVSACINWGDPVCVLRDAVDNSCLVWDHPCLDGGVQYCWAGFYACSKGCCPIGGPTPPPACPSCGTWPNCVEPDCSASCTYGCSSVSCDGGTCNPPPSTPVPATPTPCVNCGRFTPVPATPTPCVNCGRFTPVPATPQPTGDGGGGVKVDPMCAVQLLPTNNSMSVGEKRILTTNFTYYPNFKVDHFDFLTLTSEVFNCDVAWKLTECLSHGSLLYYSGCYFGDEEGKRGRGGRCGGTYHVAKPDTVSLNPLIDRQPNQYYWNSSTEVTVIREPSSSEDITEVYMAVWAPIWTGYTGAICTAPATITVTSPEAGPWWQVVDADVQTNGDLRSKVPAGYYFGLPGLGGFPGVAKYGGSTSLTSANVSEKHWLANSLSTPPNNKVQNYAYFKRLIPADVTLNPIPSNSVNGSMFASGGTASYDYFWYEYDASVTHLDLSITSPINLPDGRKVVIFVTGADLYINGSITYTSGKSVLVVLVDGNINIDPSVGGAAYDLQGFFLADGNISTGVSATPFHIKGSVAALGSLILQRNLGVSLNPTRASEVFEYDPNDIFLFPPKLSVEKTRWKEVAP